MELHELETWGDEKNIVDCIEPLASHFNLSLRQLEKVYTNIAMLYSSSAENKLRLVPIITFISIIKVINTKLYLRLQKGDITYEQLCDEINLTDYLDPDVSETNRKLHWLMMWIKYSIMSQEEFNLLDEEDRLRGFGQSLWDYGVDRQRLIPIFIQQLSMFTIE